MLSKQIRVALLAVLASWVGAAASQTTTYTAKFVEIDAGLVRLDGFGRGTSSLAVFDLGARGGDSTPSAGVQFFDTWNIDVGGIDPGAYSVDSMVVDAFGSTQFAAITFNSYDAQGARHTILFDLNASGTQAVGSGNFTVLASCPVQSCVWIDVAGTQLAGDPGAGYGGTTIATAVPEPATAALWLLGMAGLRVAARRRVAA